MGMSRLDFAAVGTALSTFKLLDLDGHGASIAGGKQYGRLFVKTTGASASDTVTIHVTLVDHGDRIASFEAVGTVTGLSDADGLELVDLVFTEGGTSRFDLMGAGSYGASEIPLQSRGPVWLVGWTAEVGGATALSVFYATSPEV